MLTGGEELATGVCCLLTRPTAVITSKRVKPLWVGVQLSKTGTHQWLGHET